MHGRDPILTLYAQIMEIMTIKGQRVYVVVGCVEDCLWLIIEYDFDLEQWDSELDRNDKVFIS